MTILNAKKAAPEQSETKVELADKKKINKFKTVKEIDREKLDEKFSTQNKDKVN